MTLGDIRTAVRERLDDPTFDTIKLDRWTNWVLQDIYSRAKYAFKEGESTLTTTAGNSEYAFSEVGDVDKISKVLLDETELVYVKDMDQFKDTEENKPAYWSTFNGNLRLYPTPDDAYELQVNYVKTLDDLTDASQSPALPARFAEIIVLGVYQKALEWNDDFDYAGVIERQYEQKLGRLVSSNKETSGQDEIINWYRPEI